MNTDFHLGFKISLVNAKNYFGKSNFDKFKSKILRNHIQLGLSNSENVQFGENTSSSTNSGFSISNSNSDSSPSNSNSNNTKNTPKKSLQYGVDFKQREYLLEDMNYQIQYVDVFDTFMPVVQKYIIGSSAVMIFFNVNDRDSFYTDVGGWITSLKTDVNNNTIDIIVVGLQGNKKNINNNDNCNNIKTRVSMEEAKKFCKAYGNHVSYCEIKASDINDVEVVSRLFESVILQVISRIPIPAEPMKLVKSGIIIGRRYGEDPNLQQLLFKASLDLH